MATRRSTSISTRSTANTTSPDPIGEWLNNLEKLSALAQTAAKHDFKLVSNAFYAPKARGYLTELRRQFLLLRSDFPRDRYLAVSAELDALEEPLKRLEQALTLPAREVLEIINLIKFRAGSDLLAAVHAANNHQPSDAPFITLEILKPGVYAKVLEEANRCFEQNCPNACAAMLRRLIESLIIEAFEAHKIEHKIKDAAGDYQELKALIGKVVAEPKLNLSRNSKSALPNLKVLGDLSVHARRHLVRTDDLKAIRNDARIAVEELAHHLQ